MCVPVLLAFRRTYPETKVVFLTKAQYAAVVRKVPGVRVLALDARGEHKGLSGLYRYSRQVRALGLLGLADLHHVLRSRIVGGFLKLSGLPFKHLDKARGEKRALTRSRNKVWRPLLPTHQRYAGVLGDLGFPLELQSGDVLPPEPLPPAFAALGRDGTWIGLAPFAAHSGKTYPRELMEGLIDMLGQQEDLRVVLFGGGQNELEILEAWEASFPYCFSAAGKAGLAEELALISRLQLMVSMDSGNGHLAAMYGRPVITLWGVTHPYTGFAPFGQPAENALTADRTAFPAVPTSIYGNKVPQGYEKAMGSIPPERVYRRILEVLGR